MHTSASLNGSRERLNLHPARAKVASAPHPKAAVGFGPHLVFDGFGCPRERLKDAASRAIVAGARGQVARGLGLEALR